MVGPCAREFQPGVFLLRCLPHDVDFTARCLIRRSVRAVIADASVASELAHWTAKVGAVLVVDPGELGGEADVEEVWAVQRDGAVIAAPHVAIGKNPPTDEELEPLRRTAAVTDPRPVAAFVTVPASALLSAQVVATAAALANAGAGLVFIDVPDLDWLSAEDRQRDALLAAVRALRAEGVGVIVEEAERVGAALVAAGATGFASVLPHVRPRVSGAAPSLAGYEVPGSWRAVDAFRAVAGRVADCPRDGCRALSSGRTLGDLREHRAHLGDTEAAAAAAEPDEIIHSMREAGGSYMRGWGTAARTARRAAA
jgi:hypothetical protein